MTTSHSPGLVSDPVTVVLDPRVAYQGFGPDDSPLAAQVRSLDIGDSIAELADAAEQLDWAYKRTWEAAAQRLAPDIAWDVWAPHHQPVNQYPLRTRTANTEDTASADLALLDEITTAVSVEFDTTAAGTTRWSVHDGDRIVGSATVPWTIRSLQDQHTDLLASRITDVGDLLRDVEHDELRLQLFDTGANLDATRERYRDRGALGYVLTDQGQSLFAGTDFHPSPLHAIDSDRTVEALAGFLSMRPGDTDDDSFSHYTATQLEWADGDGPERLWELIGTLPDTELAQMLETDKAAEQTPPVRVWRIKPTDRTDLPAVNLLADTESNATAQYPGYVSAWLADTGRDTSMDDDLFPGLVADTATDATHDGRPVISGVRGQHTLDWAIEHANHWNADSYVAIDNLPESKPVDIPATGVTTVAIRNAYATAHAGATVQAHNRSHVTVLADSTVTIHPGACVDRRPGSTVALSDTAAAATWTEPAVRDLGGARRREAAGVAR